MSSLIGLSNYSMAAAFGHPNGSGGTVYALGSEVINEKDANDFNLIYAPEKTFKSPCDPLDALDCPDIPTQSISSDNSKLKKNAFIQTRRYYDIKAKKWLYSEFYIFKASYKLSKPVEIQISYDEGKRSWRNAYAVAKQYAYLFGFVPPQLRKPTESLTLHNYYNGLMGGNNNIIVFEQRGEEHIEQGSIEEALFHEATHNYFNDFIHNKTPPYYLSWLQAKEADDDYISYYAKTNNYEDIAESLIAYYAVKYKQDRIGKLQYKILETIPNRLEYFEKLNLKLSHQPEDIESNPVE